jgi:hypothetical protein
VSLAAQVRPEVVRLLGRALVDKDDLCAAAALVVLDATHQL